MNQPKCLRKTPDLRYDVIYSARLEGDKNFAKKIVVEIQLEQARLIYRERRNMPA